MCRSSDTASVHVWYTKKIVRFRRQFLGSVVIAGTALAFLWYAIARAQVLLDAAFSASLVAAAILLVWIAMHKSFSGIKEFSGLIHLETESFEEQWSLRAAFKHPIERARVSALYQNWRDGRLEDDRDDRHRIRASLDAVVADAWLNVGLLGVVAPTLILLLTLASAFVAATEMMRASLITAPEMLLRLGLLTALGYSLFRIAGGGNSALLRDVRMGIRRELTEWWMRRNVHFVPPCLVCRKCGDDFYTLTSYCYDGLCLRCNNRERHRRRLASTLWLLVYLGLAIVLRVIFQGSGFTWVAVLLAVVGSFLVAPGLLVDMLGSPWKIRELAQLWKDRHEE